MPKSSDVVAGNTGYASEYNVLRDDALNLHGLAGGVKTIGSGAVSVTADYSAYVIAAESGTEDELVTITAGSGISTGDMILIFADEGDSIVLKNSGNLNIENNLEIKGTAGVILYYDGSEWILVGGTDGGKKTAKFEVVLLDGDTLVEVVDGIASARLFIAEELDGYVLAGAHACVTTASTSGALTLSIYNVTEGVDMLSTAITIDANEKTSYTAATQPVVNGSNAEVATGNEIRFDCDGAGTGAKGLVILLKFEENL